MDGHSSRALSCPKAARHGPARWSTSQFGIVTCSLRTAAFGRIRDLHASCRWSMNDPASAQWPAEKSTLACRSSRSMFGTLLRNCRLGAILTTPPSPPLPHFVTRKIAPSAPEGNSRLLLHLLAATSCMADSKRPCPNVLVAHDTHDRTQMRLSPKSNDYSRMARSGVRHTKTMTSMLSLSLPFSC